MMTPDDSRHNLLSRSFLALAATQFLVSLNDNMFRWLLIPIGKKILVTSGVANGEDVARTLGSVFLLLPFVILAGLAGYFTDRYSKRSVMVSAKVAEVVIMVMAILAILYGNIWLMFVVLFLMGAQSTMFSPSKFGSIPEIVRHDRISAANGLIGMTTMMAIIVGSVVGGYLYAATTISDTEPGRHHWWISAFALIGVAIVGWGTSLFIGKLKPANPTRTFPLNPAGQIVRDLSVLVSHRPLFYAALGSAFFWSLGMLATLNIDKFAMDGANALLGENDQQYVGYLLAALTLGIGLGSIIAGLWSSGTVEVGIVPIGAAGIGVVAVCLATVPDGIGSPNSAPYYLACFWLFALGTAAGLYDIPLISFLQEQAPVESRGRILAASNFITFSCMLAMSGLFYLLVGPLGLSARSIWLITGLASLLMAVAMAYFMLTPLIRAIDRLLIWILYRVRVKGQENIPTEGPVLFVSNHVTWLDGLFATFFCPRPIRLVAYADYIRTGLIGRIARDQRVIPIEPGRKSMVESIRRAREALKRGEAVYVYAEGALTRTGQIHEFKPGFLSILKGTGAPIVPVHLGGLWGSVFSFSGNKYFWKWPLRWRHPVSVTYGEPIHEARPDVERVRQAVQKLELESNRKSPVNKMIPPRLFLRNARRNRLRSQVADSTGADHTGIDVLTRALILRRLLRQHVLDNDEKNVGLLLPPSAGGVLANAALSIDARVAVNLNYTVSSEIMNACIKQAGIRHVLTSRKVMEKLDLELDAEVVYLDDFKEKVTAVDKAVGAFQAWCVPSVILERMLGLMKRKPDDLMTIIFTSGSTGVPKGVMLTYDNVGSNVRSFSGAIHLDAQDTVLGILPFFHSFGYTVTLWSVLMLDPKGAYHYSPLEARQVGKLCGQHKATLLIATPTFLRSYIRRCSVEDFASLNAVVTGAEKLPREVSDAFEKKFGVRPSEGYGTTELSPAVAVNIPPNRINDEFTQGSKEGTVGQTLPGITAKIVDLDSGEDLPSEHSGMLMIKGPNVMKGYLDRPDLTAKVIRDGWYVTGDVAVIDKEGYIRITGRQSRFSKIGGEMVPHIRIEEVIGQLLAENGGEGNLDEADDEQEAGSGLVVTSVVDSKKGERLVVLHTAMARSPDELRRALADEGLPSLWIPSADSFCQVDAIPILGTGKFDLRGIKQLAEEKSPPR